MNTLLRIEQLRQEDAALLTAVTGGDAAELKPFEIPGALCRSGLARARRGDASNFILRSDVHLIRVARGRESNHDERGGRRGWLHEAPAQLHQPGRQQPARVHCIEKELLLQQADSELVRLQILRNKTARMLKEREVL